MKFEIKARITAAVLFTADIDDDIEPRFRMRAALELAVKSGAYLAGANLAGAYLAGADLADANLAGADLTGAYLAGAYLAGADLTGANLTIKPATADEAIANLDKVREIILGDSSRLYMNHWHGAESWRKHTCGEEATCGTTHCLAGWLQVCATNDEVRKLEPNIAGYIQAPVAAPLFYSTNARVLDWLTNREYATGAHA